MRNDRKKHKRFQRRSKQHSASKRLQKEIIKKDRSLVLARKYYSKWRQINKAHKQLQAKASSFSTGSRFGTNSRVNGTLLV